MDTALRYLPFGSLVIALIMLMYKAAESNPEHNRQVMAWVLELVLFIAACGILAWFCYQCVLFTTSSAPLSRPEIGLFALDLVNVLLYADLVVTHVKRRISMADKARIDALQKEAARLSEEILDAREERLRAQMRADSAEQLRDFAQRLIEPPKSS